MNIKSYVKKLRNAADVLEDLFVFSENETEKVANKILKRKKLHWTQRPENKNKVMRMTNKIRKMRNVKKNNS